MPNAARFLISGEAVGNVVFSSVPISFMMGIEPTSGVVIDKHHPLHGQSIKDKIFVIPRGRGSCSASGVVLEMLLEGTNPAALVFRHMEEILTLGVLLAKIMFGKSIPVILIEDDDLFSALDTADVVSIRNGRLLVGNREEMPIALPHTGSLQLTAHDIQILEGEQCSKATQMAMNIIIHFATLQGARSLISVSQVHIDACVYVGKSSFIVPAYLKSHGGKFVVPVTCNSLSVDRQRWREIGADPEISQIASDIGDLYLEMGAQMSFTCAPYLLDTKPTAGEQISWGESNAVVFANSVLGARTQKYPDYLDVLIGLTGRAPNVGCHLSEGRVPLICINVCAFTNHDESLFPLLGYHIGEIVGSEIPMIRGLENSKPSIADLKAFGAGFATTSSAPLFHIRGITPEADTPGLMEHISKYIDLEVEEIRKTWRQLNTAQERRVDLIALGNPHFAIEEFAQLAKLCHGRSKRSDVHVMVTTSRFVYQMALDKGYLDIITNFGAYIITDTCWCMIEAPVIPPASRTIMTNSAKYAHYGPGITKKMFHFGSMATIVDAACTGERSVASMSPSWLFEDMRSGT